jgi:hypothetical protein
MSHLAAKAQWPTIDLRQNSAAGRTGQGNRFGDGGKHVGGAGATDPSSTKSAWNSADLGRLIESIQ